MTTGRPDRRQLAILQVSAAAEGGGAERVAMTLHQGLRARGHASWLAVGRGGGHDPDVLTVPPSPPGRLEATARRAAGTLLTPLAPRSRTLTRTRDVLTSRLTLRQRFDWWRGRESFAYPGSAAIGDLPPAPPDVIHCHNLHGGWFDLRALAAFGRRTSVALTLHDEWHFTGHCAYSCGCERWRTGCGSCPDLAIYPPLRRDGTAANWRAKHDVYRRSRFHVSAPSGWMLERARASMLAEGAASWTVIPNGIDRTVFAPGDQHDARTRLGLPGQATILLFVANSARSNRFKDLATVIDAAARVASMTQASVLLLVLGDSGPDEQRGGALVRYLPFVAEPSRVADHLRAADLYLHAAHADNFPTTILEALACGRPVVATATGGIPEQVRSLEGVPGAWPGPSFDADEATGVLVPPGEPEAMAAAVGDLLSDDGRRVRLAANATLDAAARFDLERQLDATLEWYRQILDDSCAERTQVDRVP